MTTLTTEQVVDRTVISYRRLDHWCRTGYIPSKANPPGYGRPRSWTERDVRQARALNALTLAGLGGRALLVASRAVSLADWTEPLTIRLTRHAVLVLDLPAIRQEAS